MARSHGIAIVTIIAIGTASWLALSAPDGPAPPTPHPTADRNEPEAATIAPDRADARRTSVDPGNADAAPPAAATPDEAPVPDRPATDPEPAPNVELVVMQRAPNRFEQMPVPQFRWRYQPAGQGALKGTSDGVGLLSLPPDTHGLLLVEADGFTAAQRDLVVPARTAGPLRVSVFMTARPRQVGVWITARDHTGQAVQRLRLDIWRLPSNAPEPVPGIDPAGRTMWTRIGDGPGGRYRLPSLSSGRYALRAQPCAADGAPLPLLPQRSVFRFAGNESVPLNYDFRPGVVLAVQADDDGAGARQLQAIVRGRDGAQLRIWWRSPTDRGTEVSLDAVTLPGRATTLLALPRDDYALELRRGGQPVSVVPHADSSADVRLFAALLRR